MNIRELRQDDIPFILDFWLRSYYSGMSGYRPSSEVFFKFHQAQIIDQHAKGNLVIQVATHPDDDELIMGFAVFGMDYTLHYVGVKSLYKKTGVAKRLLKSFYKIRSEITVSHWTKDIKHIQKIYKCNYNPYRFYQ